MKFVASIENPRESDERSGETSPASLETIIKNTRNNIAENKLGMAVLVTCSLILGLCTDLNMTEVLEKVEKREMAEKEKKRKDKQSGITAVKVEKTDEKDKRVVEKKEESKEQPTIVKKEDDEETKKLKEELIEQYKHKNPITDPFTGNLMCKATGIKAIQKAVERGEDKVKEPIVGFDFCGNGKVTYGIWTEIEALKRAQANMQAKKESKACLNIASSCRSQKYQNKIWRDAWVYRNGQVVKQSNGDPVTSYVVGKPCHSFHEICRAFDIDNWRQAQSFLHAEGFAGGSRGLTDDYRHFSRGGEFINADIISIRNMKNQLKLAKIKVINTGKKIFRKRGSRKK